MRDPRYNTFVKYALILSLTALAAVTLYVDVLMENPGKQQAAIHQPVAKDNPPAIIVYVKEKPRTAIVKKTRSAPAPKTSEDNVILKYAKKTGVSPKLVDAILTVETGRGKFVGKKNMFGKIPKDQRHPLANICDQLGYRPNNVPLAPKGEMGPGQFQPKTWKTMQDDVARLTGKRTPNPWKFEDSAAATALYLDRLGAETNEAEAVMRYNAGSKWRTHGRRYLARVLAAKNKSNL